MDTSTTITSREASECYTARRALVVFTRSRGLSGFVFIYLFRTLPNVRPLYRNTRVIVIIRRQYLLTFDCTVSVSLQVLSVLFFMCFVIEILYYYGIIQTIVIKLGWCLQQLLGTTAAESVNTCASVFLGMVSNASRRFIETVEKLAFKSNKK